MHLLIWSFIFYFIFLHCLFNQVVCYLHINHVAVEAVNQVFSVSLLQHYLSVSHSYRQFSQLCIKWEQLLMLTFPCLVIIFSTYCYKIKNTQKWLSYYLGLFTIKWDDGLRNYSSLIYCTDFLGSLDLVLLAAHGGNDIVSFSVLVYSFF